MSEHEANILSRMRDGLMLMPSDLGGVELDAFKMLIRKRWVTQGLSDDGRYRISFLGREALLAHEQQLDRLRDQAQHEAQQNAQRREAEKRARAPLVAAVLARSAAGLGARRLYGP